MCEARVVKILGGFGCKAGSVWSSVEIGSEKCKMYLARRNTRLGKDLTGQHAKATDDEAQGLDR